MNKYQKEIKPGVIVDVYDVLKALKVTCPATQNAIKKLLMPGQRGHKKQHEDLVEAHESLSPAITISLNHKLEELKMID